MSITKLCKCQHGKGYHRETQIRGPDNSYAGKETHECLMDDCECEKYDLLEIKYIQHNFSREDVTH